MLLTVAPGSTRQVQDYAYTFRLNESFAAAALRASTAASLPLLVGFAAVTAAAVQQPSRTAFVAACVAAAAGLVSLAVALRSYGQLVKMVLHDAGPPGKPPPAAAFGDLAAQLGRELEAGSGRASLESRVAEADTEGSGAAAPEGGASGGVRDSNANGGSNGREGRDSQPGPSESGRGPRGRPQAGAFKVNRAELSARKAAGGQLAVQLGTARDRRRRLGQVVSASVPTMVRCNTHRCPSTAIRGGMGTPFCSVRAGL